MWSCKLSEGCVSSNYALFCLELFSKLHVAEFTHHCVSGTLHQKTNAKFEYYFLLLFTHTALISNNPFTPESDQCQNSPAASQEIWHHTVWRTWLFIAYSDEKWLYYKFSLHHSYNRFLKGWENTLFELRSERDNVTWDLCLSTHKPTKEWHTNWKESCNLIVSYSIPHFRLFFFVQAVPPKFPIVDCCPTPTLILRLYCVIFCSRKSRFLQEPQWVKHYNKQIN